MNAPAGHNPLAPSRARDKEASQICGFCMQDTAKKETRSCNVMTVLFPDGKTEKAVKWHLNNNTRCPECNVCPGGFHHVGCKQERCPRCKGKILLCGCLEPEDEA